MLTSNTLGDLSPVDYATGYVIDNYWHLVNVIQKSSRKLVLTNTGFSAEDGAEDAAADRRIEEAINEISKIVESYHNNFEGNALRRETRRVRT